MDTDSEFSGWIKQGHALAPPGTLLAQTHAQIPTPQVKEHVIRVLYASCDADLRGRIFSVEFDRASPMEIVRIGNEPVLDLGDTGDFDADGVSPFQLIERDGAVFLYYNGWKRHSPAMPYTLFTGLAISEDDGRSFRRVSKSPVLPPTTRETLFRTAPYVYPTAAGWGMLYVAGDHFFTGSAGKRLPLYSLYRTFSKDGITWQAGEEMLERDRLAGEIGFGRPYLWHDETGEPSLFISVRRETGYTLVEFSYPIGAPRGMRRREILSPSETGWDSEMVCFGAPCAVGFWEYLFYNGNQFGRTGFGLARRPAVVPRRVSVDLFVDAIKACAVKALVDRD